MKKPALFVAGLVVAVVAWNLTHVPAQEKAAPAVAAAKWEYRIVTGEPSEDALNRLGDEGWELAAATANVSGRGMTNGTGGRISTNVRLVFKRAKR